MMPFLSVVFFNLLQTCFIGYYCWTTSLIMHSRVSILCQMMMPYLTVLFSNLLQNVSSDIDVGPPSCIALFLYFAKRWCNPTNRTPKLHIHTNTANILQWILIKLFCFYAVLSKIPRCWWNSRASQNTNLGRKTWRLCSDLGGGTKYEEGSLMEEKSGL